MSKCCKYSNISFGRCCSKSTEGIPNGEAYIILFFLGFLVYSGFCMVNQITKNNYTIDVYMNCMLDSHIKGSEEDRDRKCQALADLKEKEFSQYPETLQERLSTMEKTKYLRHGEDVLKSDQDR